MLDVAYAQAAAPPGVPSAADQMLHMISILAITIGIFYFLIIRPQQKKQRESEQMLASIRKGDRVLTTGGVFGTVISADTKGDVVVLRVSENVKMEFTKQSIVQVVERGG